MARMSAKPEKETPTEPVKEPAPTGHPDDPVRVRHPEGFHCTTTRQLAANAGWEILEGRPAVDGNGTWLPIKPKTNKGE